MKNVGDPCTAPDELVWGHYTMFDRVFYALSNGASFVQVHAIINVLRGFFDFRSISQFSVGTQLRTPTTDHCVVIE